MNPETTPHDDIRARALFSATGALAVLFLISALLYGFPERKNLGEEPPPVVSNAFDEVHLQAKAAYVFDMRSGEVLYEKNAQVQLPLASLTKLMLAAVAAKELDHDKTVTIAKEHLKAEGDSGLKAGERWNLSKLLAFTLLTSSNDGAAAIASAYEGLRDEEFVSQMNREAQDLGLSQTYFINSTGLDVNLDLSGGYGSARDVAILLGSLVTRHPEVLDATQEPKLLFSSLSRTLHSGVNTDPLVARLPGVIGSKTGYTDLAGGNLAFAFDAGLGSPIVAVVLGSTYDGRFADVERLVAAVFKNNRKHLQP